MLNFPELEEKILAQWEKEKTFEESLRRRKEAGAKEFVFFEGPPTANGRPGIHHVLARAFKDIICRYKTMTGSYVPRKAGWDTHGLPVELEVERQLGLKSKKDIELYGIAAFNKKCKESVWTYKDEWEKLTKRIGYWLDMGRPYITYEWPYMETLWWIIRQMWDKQLLYEGHKVVPLCTRCGTGLSSHEVAQGYKEVSEDSIYIKFKVRPGQKIGDQFISDDNTFILVWTTTPWTLPANIALAVGNGIEYLLINTKSQIDRKEENLIIEKDRWRYLYTSPGSPNNQFVLHIVGNNATEIFENSIIKTINGSELVGLSYEPLYKTLEEKSETAYKVYAADFVSTTDGTGVVHIAPMYGEDDYNLGKEHRLPHLHTVEFDGTVKKGLGIPGEGKFAKGADKDIISNLHERTILYMKESYRHDYPFCWRCDTPLLYYAMPSWFVKMSALWSDLQKANKDINWVPSHVKEGRFGEWLREVKDWNFSRQRYWGTPLPIWTCEQCGEKHCVGTIEEMDALAFERSGNRYWVMRHGQADSNCNNVIHSRHDDETMPSHLTETGKDQVEKASAMFNKEGIDLIIASDFARTRETAEIVAKEVDAELRLDLRLRELDHGDYHGKTVPEYLAYYAQHGLNRFTDTVPGGETLNDVKRRMMAVIADLEKNERGKNILIVSHGDPLLILRGAARNFSREEQFETLRNTEYLENAQCEALRFKTLPYDEDGNLTLHRPYVDAFRLRCPKDGCGGAMRRVEDIADVWFDSGAMPFAQRPLSAIGYRLSDLKEYPADYIAEAMDQTRGWFYTLLAVATALGKEAPFKNVVCLSHVLDKTGHKMSKSKGNVVKPQDIIEKYGADALRWYFFTVNDPGDYKLFDEKHVAERMRGFLGTLWNCAVFYKTYCKPKDFANIDVGDPLDQWLLDATRLLIIDVKKNLEMYNITAAARSIEDFVINNLSQWYLRRSRDRLQSDKHSMMVFRDVLLVITRMSAPFIPFITDAIWRDLGSSGSVHHADFPTPEEIPLQISVSDRITVMDAVRLEASKGLAVRAAANMKIRQKLGLYITSLATTAAVMPLQDPEKNALQKLLEEELNVKEVRFGDKDEPLLDIQVTEELKLEGEARELTRRIQNARKETGMQPGETVTLTVGTEEEKMILEHPEHGKAITQKTNVASWIFVKDSPLSIKAVK